MEALKVEKELRAKAEVGCADFKGALSQEKKSQAREMDELRAKLQRLRGLDVEACKE